MLPDRTYMLGERCQLSVLRSNQHLVIDGPLVMPKPCCQMGHTGTDRIGREKIREKRLRVRDIVELGEGGKSWGYTDKPTRGLLLHDAAISWSEIFPKQTRQLCISLH